MVTPDNVQNKPPNNPIAASIRIGCRHADRILDPQFTNPSQRASERKGVGEDSVGNIVRARGTLNS